MSTAYIPAPPTLLDDLGWLLRLVADTVVAFFTSLLHPVTPGRHTVRPGREPFGADTEWPTELELMRVELDAARRLVPALEATQPYTVADYADAMPRLWDATEVALRAGRIGGE